MTIALTWIAADGTETVLTDHPLRVLRGVSGLDLLAPTTTWEPRISFDGSSRTGSRFDVRSVMLPIGISADVPQEVLRSLASSLGRGTGRLRANVHGVERTLFDVEWGMAADTRDANTSLPGWRKISTQLTAGDPWWQGPVMSAFLPLGAQTPSNDAGVPSDDPLTPSNGGGTVMVTVDGDEDAVPLLVITGPFDAIQVANLTLPGLVELASPLPAGKTMFVDSRPSMRGPRMDGGKVDNYLLTRDSRALSLASGENVLAVSAAGSTGASSVELRWRNRWGTP